MSSNCNNCNLDGGAISLQNSVRPDIVELIISDSEFDGNYMSSNGDNVYSRGSVLKADDRSLIQIINTIFKNTLTSYSPNKSGLSDGNTASDVERILAFHELNLIDPIKYNFSWKEVLKNALIFEKDFKKKSD
mgnify:CR=1 FL=1